MVDVIGFAGIGFVGVVFNINDLGVGAAGAIGFIFIDSVAGTGAFVIEAIGVSSFFK
jgi:hypothetical protein